VNEVKNGETLSWHFPMYYIEEEKTKNLAEIVHAIESLVKDFKRNPVKFRN